MEPQTILAFLAIALLISCVPGPDWAFTISAGLAPRSFAPAVAGLCTGYVLHTVLLVAGLAALMTAQPSLLLWISLAGACYLLWIGFQTSRSWKAAGFLASTSAQPDRGMQSFVRGFGTSSLNPKSLLFFVALTPQFINHQAAFSVPVQSLILGLTFVASTALIYTLVAAGSRRLLRSHPGAARGITLASGLIMSLLGLVLLAEQVAPLGSQVGNLLHMA